jgi:hypothetical protein
MTASYSNVDVTTDNFATWLTRTNQLLTALNTIVVTTNSNTTVGNSAITGDFTSNNMYTHIIYGGEFGNTSTLTLGTNTSITGTFVTTGSANVGGVLTVSGNTSLASANVSGTLGVGGVLTVVSNTSLGGTLSVGNTLFVNTATTSNNSHTFFMSGTGNTVIKNDASGFRTSLDVHSKSEANTLINNAAAAVDASAIAYAIALG